MTGIAIVGAGRIAQWHALAVDREPRADLVAVVDHDLAAAEALAAQFGAQTATTQLDAVCALEAVDAVIVCAPTARHHEIALLAIAHGKHVLVEKPLATSVGEAEEMVRAADAVGVQLMSSQTLRFMPMFGWAKAFIEAGGLGTPIQAIERRLTHRLDNFPWWKELPNFLVAHWGSHSLDLISYLLDDTVSTAVCDAASVVSAFGVVDDFNLQLRFSRGARAGIHMSFASRVPVHDILLIGETATLDFSCYRSVRVNGEVAFELPENEMLEAAFAAELGNLLDAMAGTADLRSSGRSVLPSYAALDAAERSIASGQVEQVRTS
jgi:2-hydroxy-4-carboxymuconate semialdehyde hemiacetal dehydrogenase